VKRLLLLLALLAIPASAAPGTPSWILTLGEWSGPKTGERILDMKPLRAAVQALDSTPKARLEVMHNGGEGGVFWAVQIEGWLVSLGVPGSRIVLRTGAIKLDRVRILLLPPGIAPTP